MRAAKIFRNALKEVLDTKDIVFPVKTTIEAPKDRKHGDLATNIALVLAKALGKKPRDIANEIKEALEPLMPFARFEIAGAGFINCTFAPSFWWETLMLVHKNKESYGKLTAENPRSVLLEYVSANPTGPLHIGHGRGAAVGDSVLRILKHAGHKVFAEYYINDAGNQMRLLGLSIWLRALELKDKNPIFPESYYKGEYIIDIAKEMLEKNPLLTDMPEQEGIDTCYEYGMHSISEGIRADLREFRVHHDRWFSEKSLVDNNEVQAGLDFLKAKGLAYEKDEALWFETIPFGDDKDRVLIKRDGNLTYFASDIAYHKNKFDRGYDYLIDVLGADHHGYLPRMRAAISALERNPDTDFGIILIQLVNLLRNNVPIAMSTRSGEFDTLSEVVQEVGVDATRFMFLSRKSDAPLDFDLELVKQRNLENPVYYVQYAHARVYGLLRRAKEAGVDISDTSLEQADLSSLTNPEEMELLQTLDLFEDSVEMAAKNLTPHTISYYLMDLAGKIHTYYAKYPVLADIEKTSARLLFLKTCAQVIHNGLELLGVEAPDKM